MRFVTVQWWLFGQQLMGLDSPWCIVAQRSLEQIDSV